MTAGRQRFNIYLLLALALAIAGGCRTAERKRRQQASTLRLHLEARPDGTVRNEVVQVFRGQPMSIGVEKVPFLTEGNVKEASVVDAVGGFALRIQFDHQGALLLEHTGKSRHTVLLPGAVE